MPEDPERPAAASPSPNSPEMAGTTTCSNTEQALEPEPEPEAALPPPLGLFPWQWSRDTVIEIILPLIWEGLKNPSFPKGEREAIEAGITVHLGLFETNHPECAWTCINRAGAAMAAGEPFYLPERFLRMLLPQNCPAWALKKRSPATAEDYEEACNLRIWRLKYAVSVVCGHSPGSYDPALESDLPEDRWSNEGYLYVLAYERWATTTENVAPAEFIQWCRSIGARLPEALDKRFPAGAAGGAAAGPQVGSTSRPAAREKDRGGRPRKTSPWDRYILDAEWTLIRSEGAQLECDERLQINYRILDALEKAVNSGLCDDEGIPESAKEVERIRKRLKGRAKREAARQGQPWNESYWRTFVRCEINRTEEPDPETDKELARQSTAKHEEKTPTNPQTDRF